MESRWTTTNVPGVHKGVLAGTNEKGKWTMVSIEECNEIAASTCLEHGFQIIDVITNPRLSTSLGRMVWMVDGPWDNRIASPQYIEINSRYMIVAERAQVMDTLLHELAHYFDGWKHKCNKYVQHGASWQAWCIKIGAAPKRFKDETPGYDLKWKVECQNPLCSMVYDVNRLSRKLERHIIMDTCRCGTCHKGRLMATDRKTGYIVGSNASIMASEKF